MNQDTSNSIRKRVVKIENSDIVTGAYLTLIANSVVLSTNVSMSENTGRWKPKGGLTDPLREGSPRLSVSEQLFRSATILGSKIFAVGQDIDHSQKCEFTLQTQSDFDGVSWEHNRGWLKFSESDHEEQCWNCWFNLPYSIFQSLASTVRRKSVCRMSIHAELRTHGSEFTNDNKKIDVEGVEAFITSINWDEESELK